MGSLASEEDYSTLTHVSRALSNAKLSGALTDWFGENVNFFKWEYVGNIGKGDSYLSDVRRIRIHGINQYGISKNVQVILKTMPKNLSRRITFRSDEFFRNEIAFYTKVLPALLKFHSKMNLKEPFDCHVKLFLAYSDGIDDVICLEDVSPYGYRNIDRQRSIDLEHCMMTLRTLAQFHAISFAMRDQEPEEFRMISRTVSETYCELRLWNWYKRFWDRICVIVVDAVEQEYPGTEYVKKVKEFAVPKTYFKMVRAVRDTRNAVISHGDPWTNNFLYKYKNNQVTEAKMIDFQISRFGSPVLDLSYFIYNSTSQELRSKHYDVLLSYYYKVLSTQIKRMGSNPETVYSWEVFMDEVKQYSLFSLGSSFEMTPLILLDPEDAIDMEIEGDQEVNIDDVWNLGLIKSKEGRLRLADNVVHCVDNGYI